MFLKRLFCIKITNVILFLPVSDRKRKQINKSKCARNCKIINNRKHGIRLLTFMFTINTPKEKKDLTSIQSNVKHKGVLIVRGSLHF